MEEARGLLNDDDPELRLLAQEEFADAAAAVKRLDPQAQSSRNAIVEITAGVGGDEACLFVGTLFRMYERFAHTRGWTVEETDWNEGKQGGFKSITFSIDGLGAYDRLRLESGIHRVQRFSETAATDIMHTSAAGVVVLPEIEDVEVVVKRSDVRIDTFSAGGPGGQHQNKTQSGVRLTHKPTGIAVEIRDGRSQTHNLSRGWKILASRIQDAAEEQAEKDVCQTRKSLRGRGSRCEKIRTYNYPQDRVTDHRIGFTAHNLPKILDGGLDPVIEALIRAEQ